MFDELTKYKKNGHFFLISGDSLEEVCNAPTDKSGIYVVYALKNGGIELVFIGRSGEIEKDGSMAIWKEGLGGLKDRIVNGHQFGNVPRSISWPRQIELQDIEALDVYWYVTHIDKFKDCPRVLENVLLNKHLQVYGRVPRWNSELYIAERKR